MPWWRGQGNRGGVFGVFSRILRAFADPVSPPPPSQALLGNTQHTHSHSSPWGHPQLPKCMTAPWGPQTVNSHHPPTASESSTAHTWRVLGFTQTQARLLQGMVTPQTQEDVRTQPHSRGLQSDYVPPWPEAVKPLMLSAQRSL